MFTSLDFVNANVRDIDEAVRYGRQTISAAEIEYNNIQNEVTNTLNNCKYEYAQALKNFEKANAALEELRHELEKLVDKIHDLDAAADTCRSREDYDGERDYRAQAAMWREDLPPLEDKIKDASEIVQKMAEELNKQAVALEQAQSLYDHTQDDLKKAYQNLDEVESSNREAEKTKSKIESK